MDDQIDPQLESFWKIPISNDRIIFVDSVDSEEFGLFCWAMERSYIVGMDCEWKPSFRQNSSGTRRVSVLQIACRIYGYDDGHRLNKNGLEENFYDETKNCCRTGMVSAREEEVKVDIEEKFNSSENSFAVLGAFSEEMVNFEIGQTKCDVYYGGENFLDKEAEWRQKIFGEVGPSEGQNVQELIFLLDLLELPVSSFWRTLKTMFVSPDILKLGFKFKQDLVYLAGSFCGQDAHSCFDKVDPYIDIGKLYHLLQNCESWVMNRGRKLLIRESKSLASICEEVLGVRLSKDSQCSDWEQRPLTKEQTAYAASDAHCLLALFDVFHHKVFHSQQGKAGSEITNSTLSTATVGLKELLVGSENDSHHNVFRTKLGFAVDILKATFAGSLSVLSISSALSSYHPRRNNIPLCEPILKIAQTFGERILLSECKSKAKSGGRKGRSRRSRTSEKCKEEHIERQIEWHGPPPWDPSLGGNGDPKFLCDVMVEGLARQLRCVGIDAACPSVKKADPRQLVEQAQEEKRILLTRDIKLLRRHLMPSNQAYQVKNLAKQDQLVEVIETFSLKICEYELMSRCIKCNGRFIEKSLTTNEAIAAATSEQVIPEFLIDRDLDFWQCADCRQIYWEGTQYHNAIQQFSAVCKAND